MQPALREKSCKAIPIAIGLAPIGARDTGGDIVVPGPGCGCQQGGGAFRHGQAPRPGRPRQIFPVDALAPDAARQKGLAPSNMPTKLPDECGAAASYKALGKRSVADTSRPIGDLE